MTPALFQAGAVAILFRQTNVVWVAFTLAVSLLQDFLPLVVGAPTIHPSVQDSQCDPVRDQDNPLLATADPLSLRRRATRVPGAAAADGHVTKRPLSTVRVEVGIPAARDGKGGKSVQKEAVMERRQGTRPGGFGPHRGTPPVPELLLRLARAALVDALHGGPRLRRHLPLAVPVVAFAALVWGWNGGAVALGDKEHHAPGGPPHLAQLAYLSAVAASLWGCLGADGAFSADAWGGFSGWARRRGKLGCAGLLCGVVLGLWR